MQQFLPWEWLAGLAYVIHPGIGFEDGLSGSLMSCVKLYSAWDRVSVKGRHCEYGCGLNVAQGRSSSR